jgi:hypothetical protein
MSDGEDVGLLDAGVVEENADTGGASDVSALDTATEEPGNDLGDLVQEGEQQDKGAEGDKRTLPVQVRNAIRKFTQANPDFAKENPRFEKEVVGALFTQKALNELGGIQAIRSLKETVEMHGGVEGLQELASEVEGSRALDVGLEKGDPKVIENYVKEFPEGFKRIVPTALDALAKSFPEDYQRLGSNILHNTFRDNRSYEDLGSLGQIIGASKDANAIAAYNRLVDLLTNVQKNATSKQADPYADRAKQLDEREQSLAKKDQTSFLNGVRAEVDTAVVKDVNKMIAAALKGRVMEPQARNRFLNEVRTAIATKVHSEPNYSRQWPGVRDAADHGRAVKFNYAAYSKAIPAAVSSTMKDPVWRSYFNGAAKAAPTARTERPANATVTGRPAIGDVDFSRTDKATFLGSRTHGQAYLRNGKIAKW